MFTQQQSAPEQRGNGTHIPLVVLSMVFSESSAHLKSYNLDSPTGFPKIAHSMCYCILVERGEKIKKIKKAQERN